MKYKSAYNVDTLRRSAMKMQSTLLGLILFFSAFNTYSFDSGSTGADGDLVVSGNTVLDVPEPDGVFNFNNITIQSGATLTFNKNTANTPVYMLATGDVLIEGGINLNGGNAPSATDPNNLASNGLPGEGAPGGFTGGKGGDTNTSGNNSGSAGKGPGGGTPGRGTAGGSSSTVNDGCGGGGAGFRQNGSQAASCTQIVSGGSSYGIEQLFPLFIGGSGGGGASGGKFSRGAGGGGGGGAILIASSGRITFTGSINARGGNGGNAGGQSANDDDGGGGGAGSGGAVRIIATELVGNGSINVSGGTRGLSYRSGGSGSSGWIRLEADNMLYSGNATPQYTTALPNPAFLANSPSIVITSISGQAVTVGGAPVDLPAGAANPIDVVINTQNIPTDSTINVTIIPDKGNTSTVSGGAISGTEANGTATASVNLSTGTTVLQASTTFSVTLAMGEQLSKYAEGQIVKQMTIEHIPGQGSQTILITDTGKEYTWPSYAIALN